MINGQTLYVRHNPSGQVVRVAREGYQGLYVYIDSKQVLVPMFNLSEL